MQLKRFLFTVAACVAVNAAARAQSTADAPRVYATADNATRFRVETVATGLEIPWALAFAPDGRLFVTERPGRLRVVTNGVLQPKPLAEFPEVQTARETGLWDWRCIRASRVTAGCTWLTLIRRKTDSCASSDGAKPATHSSSAKP